MMNEISYLQLPWLVNKIISDISCEAGMCDRVQGDLIGCTNVLEIN
jgi:hypothetical protein